jgi:hypothetical protein
MVTNNLFVVLPSSDLKNTQTALPRLLFRDLFITGSRPFVTTRCRARYACVRAKPWLLAASAGAAERH